jgi:hypothetical protein
MLWLISIVFAILAILGLKLLLPISRKRWRQVRFIRETLGGAGRSEDRRVNVSLSTVPESDQESAGDDSLASETNPTVG